MARKLKYEPARVDRILNALETGATERIACAYGGISVDTLGSWKKKYPDFSDRLQEAEAKGAIRHLLNVNRAANGVIDPQTGQYTLPPEWRASAWLLEHRYPEEFGKSVVDTRLSGPTGEGPVLIRLVRGDGRATG